MNQIRKKLWPTLIFPGLRSMIIFALLFSVWSCTDKIEKFDIERMGSLSFSTDDFTIQYAEDFHFYRGKIVLHYYEDGSSEIFNRFLLEATGKTPEGNSMIIDIEFDIATDTAFIGTYTPVYNPSVGGIYSFSYLKETAPGVWASYNLDTSDLSSTYFRIKRQNEEEKLILGDFFAKLQNDKNSSEKIILYDGVFKDISYSLD